MLGYAHRHPWLLPAASGLALPLAYAPYSVPGLQFVGLVPLLLWLGRPRSRREVFWGGWAFALPFFVGGLFGLALITRFTSAGLLAFVALLAIHVGTFFFFPIALNVLSHTRPLPLALAAPPLWLVSEHARTYGDMFFPWVSLGYSLAEWPRLIQHADLIGVYGISFWIVLTNALIADALLRRAAGARWRAAVIAAAVVVAVPIVYGSIRWRGIQSAIDAAPAFQVAVVQPNVPQRKKWTPEAAAEIFTHVNAMIVDAERSSPDLVIGPEATLPFALPESATRLPASIQPGARPLLLGVITGIGAGRERQVGSMTAAYFDQHYNSAVLVGPDRSVVARHDKQYLVPFAEQIPYRQVLGFVLPMMRKQFGRFRQAERLSVLELPGPVGPVRFGTLICYESLFPDLARRLHAMGADFFVNISNDAWFGRTSFPFQHAAFAVFRAVENRTSVVRCANTGVSALFDPLGREVRSTGLFEEAVMSASVPLVRTATVYGRVGDLAIYVAYLGTLAALLTAWRFRRNSRD